MKKEYHSPPFHEFTAAVVVVYTMAMMHSVCLAQQNAPCSDGCLLLGENS